MKSACNHSMHLFIFQLNAQLILTGVNKHKDKVGMYNNSIPLELPLNHFDLVSKSIKCTLSLLSILSRLPLWKINIVT